MAINRTRYYPETRFGGFTNIDGTIAFFTRVNALLEPDFVVLDVGCGRGSRNQDEVPIRRGLATLKGKVRKVIGIDVDPDAAVNPMIDEFHLLDGPRWPLEDNSVDMIVSDHVMEHVVDPAAYLDEARRVLKDGGYLCLRTPNRRSYIALMARIIPNRYHSRVVAMAQDGRAEEDVFPTVYKCNTVGTMRKMLRERGFDCAVFNYEAEPSYLEFSPVAYFFGTLHQRLAPKFIKPSIFAFGKLQKSAA